jgi:hypothetical protein
MSYIPVRSGFTGPSARIGGSSDYHIDLKMLDTLSLPAKVGALDSLARKYKSIGREIEFSNQAVSGLKYNLSDPFDERARVLMQAANAHAPRQGWHSIDFYVPLAGKSRFDQGAVEGASIFLPSVAGGKVRRGKADNYGYFSEALDPSGQTLFKVGHGDITRPEKESKLNVLGTPPPAPVLPEPAGTKDKADSDSNSNKMQLAKAMMFQQLLNQSSQPSLIQGILSRAMKPYSYQDYLG